MTEIPWESVINGTAGIAALYLAIQMRAAVQAIKHVVRNHETRLEKHEDRLDQLETHPSRRQPSRRRSTPKR